MKANIFAVDDIDRNNPVVKAARLIGVSEAMREARKSAGWMRGAGIVLLGAILLVSLAHAAHTVGSIAPQGAQLSLSNDIYKIAAVLFIVVVDATIIYLTLAQHILRLCQLQAPRGSVWLILALTLALNANFVAEYSAGDATLIWAVKGLTGNALILLLPTYIVVALIAVKGAISSLSDARLKFGIELAGIDAAVREIASELGPDAQASISTNAQASILMLKHSPAMLEDASSKENATLDLARMLSMPPVADAQHDAQPVMQNAEHAQHDTQHAQVGKHVHANAQPKKPKAYDLNNYGDALRLASTVVNPLFEYDDSRFRCVKCGEVSDAPAGKKALAQRRASGRFGCSKCKGK